MVYYRDRHLDGVGRIHFVPIRECRINFYGIRVVLHLIGNVLFTKGVGILRIYVIVINTL